MTRSGAFLLLLIAACNSEPSQPPSNDTGRLGEDAGAMLAVDDAASQGRDAAMARDAEAQGTPDAASEDAGLGLSEVDAGEPDGGPPAKTHFKVLFDNTKHEQAGNADWVVFDSGRYAALVHPSTETDWKGGLSSWGYALHQTGRYDIEELPPGSRITFGDSSNQQDLAGYDAFIVPEPNNKFSAAEATAIEAYVRAGGGLFAIADHTGADRDGDGIDAVEAWDGLFDAVQGAFGVRFDTSNITDSPDSNVLVDASDPVLHGAFGEVGGTTYYAGATMTVDPTKNPTVKALIWKSGAPQGTTKITFATSLLGDGRIAFIGDSSPADDGTGEKGLLDGWDDPKGTNKALFLNATAWLAGDSSR
jgi:hypothetical protein